MSFVDKQDLIFFLGQLSNPHKKQTKRNLKRFHHGVTWIQVRNFTVKEYSQKQTRTVFFDKFRKASDIYR